MVSAKEEPEAPISLGMDGILKVHKQITEGCPYGIGELGRAQQGGSGMTSLGCLWLEHRLAVQLEGMEQQ